MRTQESNYSNPFMIMHRRMSKRMRQREIIRNDRTTFNDLIVCIEVGFEA